MNKNTAAFIMPVKLGSAEVELRLFREAVASVKAQTDDNWILIMVDDFSENRSVYDVIDEMKNDLGDKLHVIYTDKNCGSGAARNKGVRYAHAIGAPFILFNDSDDISDPRRLELVRKAFEDDDTVNVVYTSFDVIDEYVVPHDSILMSVREIIDGHQVDIVEGENAWIGIATRKKYTNLTSCTAVRTSLAVQEPSRANLFRRIRTPGSDTPLIPANSYSCVISRAATEYAPMSRAAPGATTRISIKRCSRSIPQALRKRSRSRESTEPWAVSTRTISERFSMCVWRSACFTENLCSIVKNP